MKILHKEANLLTLRERPVLAWICASIFGSVGLFILAQPYMTTFTCTRIEPTICKLERSRLLGSKSEEIPVDTLKSAEVVRGNGTSQLVISTSNNEIYFTSDSSIGESQKRAIASRIKDFIKNPEIPSLRERYDERLSMFLFGGSCFTASFMILHLFSSVTSCVFDKTLDTLTISRQGLFGKEVIQGRLSEIEDVQVAESTSSDSSTYRVSIVLMSGDRLPLTPYYSSGRKSKQETASDIKSFLRGDKSQC